MGDAGNMYGSDRFCQMDCRSGKTGMFRFRNEQEWFQTGPESKQVFLSFRNKLFENQKFPIIQNGSIYLFLNKMMFDEK